MTDLLGHEPAQPRKSANHGEAGYERVTRDAYFTEPWVTRALLSAVRFGPVVWEPACGDGRMAREIEAAGYLVFSSDIHDYGYPSTEIRDFLRSAFLYGCNADVTNPPFDLARQFIVRAIEGVRTNGGKVAILQRHEFDAPKTNRPLFEYPFACKLILPRRPRWTDSADKASPRFPYAWYVWDWSREPSDPTIRWLP